MQGIMALPSFLPMSGIRIYSDERVDDLLHGELKLIQKARGYRYSVDALLLAHFVLPVSGLKIIDLGCAGGVIPLILAKRSNPRKIVGVEIQASLAGMAKRNVRLNHLEDKIQILHRDMKKLPDIYQPASFDLVISNPPFIPKGTGQICRLRERAVARHELKIDLDAVIHISAYLVKPTGRICLICPVRRLEQVKARILSEKLFPSQLQLAFDRKGGAAKLFCISAGKRPVSRLKRLSPIYIQTPSGRFAL
jgi:tRNA1Val (adenine37-N6)-methyltransferase